MRILLGCILGLLVMAGCKNPSARHHPARRPVSDVTHEFEPTPRDTAQALPTDSIRVIPIRHASFVMQMNGKTITVDPVGDPALYQNLPKPDFILLTHKHYDHFSPKTLTALVSSQTPIIAPKSVKEEMPEGLKKQTRILRHRDTLRLFGIRIKAVPAYNIRPKALQYHPKSRKDNGYVVSANGKRVYISGDTENIPELRNLHHIDLAFVCMNLPYTMSVNEAVRAVLTFKPKKVYPYHYKGTKGYSAIRQFKREVEEKDPQIKVVLLNWYPERHR